jgi:hypothetical protein
MSTPVNISIKPEVSRILTRRPSRSTTSQRPRQHTLRHHRGVGLSTIPQAGSPCARRAGAEIERTRLTLDWIIRHVHADHLSAALPHPAKLGVKLASADRPTGNLRQEQGRHLRSGAVRADVCAGRGLRGCRRCVRGRRIVRACGWDLAPVSAVVCDVRGLCRRTVWCVDYGPNDRAISGVLSQSRKALYPCWWRQNREDFIKFHLQNAMHSSLACPI